MAYNTVLCAKSGTPKHPPEHQQQQDTVYTFVIRVLYILYFSKGANKGSEQLKDESETKTECIATKKTVEIVFIFFGMVGMLYLFSVFTQQGDDKKGSESAEQ